MATGKTKGTMWALSIEAPNEKKGVDMEDTLKAYQSTFLNNSLIGFVATIIHDKDKKDNGEARAPHLHVFVETEEMTKATALSYFVDLLQVNKEQISIEPTNSPILQVQYLTHKGKPHKHQYDYEAILTNNSEELMARYNAEYVAPKDKDEELQEALLNSQTLTELMATIGVSEANKYRGLYNQIKEEQKTKHDNIVMDFYSLKQDYANLLKEYKKLLDTCENSLTLKEQRFINLEDFIKRFWLFDRDDIKD